MIQMNHNFPVGIFTNDMCHYVLSVLVNVIKFERENEYIRLIYINYE